MEELHDSWVAESATDGIVRTVLAGLPRLQGAGLPSDMVGILWRAVLDAGLDLIDVRLWLWAAHGYEAETYLRVVGEDRAPLAPVPYLAVPVKAFLPAG